MSNSPKVERKLAAIMFTDIADYTALSAKDSTKASKLLKTQRDTLKPIVDKHGGSWMKEIGDGLLLTFDSATSAVECSIAIQEITKDIEDLNLRIGIHQGEVIRQDGDVIGDDVNITSRIEPFSAVGGVAISDKIYRDISSNQDFETEYIGKPKLKGVSQEVKVYCIVSHQLPKTDVSQVSAKLEKEKYNIFSLTGGVLTAIGIGFWLYISFFDVSFAEESEVPSVAILPLDNKGAEEDEFYAYGISSDLISDVASAGLIRVASLSDIEKLDYTNIDNIELSKKLFVRYITTGTIWKRDSIFQLSMELYDTETEKVVWSERWQKNWNELPLIRDELSENILEKLKVNQKTDFQSYTSNPEAYEYYLKAKYKWHNRKTIEDKEIVRGLLNKAIYLDDNLIAAKNLLGNTEDDYEKALEIYTSALKQAEQLDDKSSIAILVGNIGQHYSNQGAYDKALDYYHRALAIFEELGNKNSMSISFHAIGVVFDYQGKDDKALDYIEKAFGMYKELGKKHGMALTLMSIGIMHSQQGDYDKALEYYAKSLTIIEELDKKSSKGHILSNMGNEYKLKGDYGKAFDCYNKSLLIAEELGQEQHVGININSIGHVYFTKGDYSMALDYYERARAIYEKIDFKSGLSSTLRYIGFSYYIKGKNDKTIEYYKMSLAIGDGAADKHIILWSFNSIGNFYYSQGDFEKSKEFLEKSLSLYKELDIELGLGFVTYLSLTNKKIGNDYDVKEVIALIKETENIEFYTNFRLYELLEDKSYLETAYNQIQEKADAMDDELKEKFLNYPNPKQIIEEYNKVFNTPS